jgi:hypothetical protein
VEGRRNTAPSTWPTSAGQIGKCLAPPGRDDALNWSPSLTPPMRRKHGAALGFALATVGVLPMGLQAGESAGADADVEVPLLRGVGAHDPRGRVDPDKAPWRASGKLQVTSLNLLGSSRTGTLVGPLMVLTAAHCVHKISTQYKFPPGSWHFLIGYDRGLYAAHAVGVKINTGPATTTADQARPLAVIGR